MNGKTKIVSFVIAFLALTNASNAQEIQRSFYGNAGSASHSATITLSQTFGEPMSNVLEYYDNDSTKFYLLRQGFEQSIKDTTIYTYINNALETTISVYPNPTHNFINIKLDNGGLDNLQINIYDALGRFVKRELLILETTTIDVTSLAQGAYFIHLEDLQTKSKATFPFIKI